VNFSNIEGRTELAYTLQTHGSTQRDLIANADGRIHVEVISGALHGVDLGGVARTIRNALRGELIAPEARTPFQGFSASFAVAHGALASDNLSFNTPDLRIPGVGVIDLAARRLDLRISPRSPRGGIAIPFSIRGPFEALNYNSDIGGSALHDIENRVRAVQSAAAAQP
jgi:AsmA protein